MSSAANGPALPGVTVTSGTFHVQPIVHKPGWKTSEFWTNVLSQMLVTVGTTVVPFLTESQNPWLVAVGAVVQAVMTVHYTAARRELKLSATTRLED